MTSTGAVARSSLVMAAGTFTSRVLGLVRAVLLVGVLGATGLTADAFQVANTLPNNFYLLLAGGILNAVLVPQIVKASSHPDGGAEFVNRILTLAVTVFLVATVLITAAAPLLVRVFFDTSDADALALATAFAYLCLPQVFFYALYTVLGQVLNANNRFGPYMWAPVLANLIALAGLIAFRRLGYPVGAAPGEWDRSMIWLLAGSATVSIAVQALCLLIPLRRMGFRFRAVWGVRGVGLGSASRVAMWTFAAVVVSQLGYVVTSRVLTRASTIADERGLTVPGLFSFQQAFLLFVLPHSLVTVSIVTALFTRMSHAARERDTGELVGDLRRGLLMPAVVLVPGVVFGVLFAPLVTRTLFFQNPTVQTDAIALVMVPLFLGVVPYGWVYLSERFFYAFEDARIPFLVQCLVTGFATVVTLLASLAAPTRTAAVVAGGQSTAYVLGAVLGFALIRRRVGPVGLGGVVGTYLRLLVPALVSGLLGVLLVRLAGPGLADDRLGGALVLAGVGTLLMVGTVLGAHLLGVRQVGELLGPVLRRVRRG
ncbi:MAG TPA: lipid II flippase MurJ [Dermatophilaceae bacterium]|nr:lipid II flippase MurJ [Dermatophilaceae bacterium]